MAWISDHIDLLVQCATCFDVHQHLWDRRGKEKESYAGSIWGQKRVRQDSMLDRLLVSCGVFSLCSAVCEVRSSQESPNGGWMRRTLEDRNHLGEQG